MALVRDAGRRRLAGTFRAEVAQVLGLGRTGKERDAKCKKKDPHRFAIGRCAAGSVKPSRDADLAQGPLSPIFAALQKGISSLWA
jgi:hypothetical protein